MKTELLATAEESSSSNNGQFTRREKMEKLLGMCLTRDKLLLLELKIGEDFDLLKQTLVGCFVRVPVQGRPMLVAIRSVKDSCQIEWARFGRRLRLSDSLGYFEFDQVDPEMPGQDEMERWCQRREQNGREPLSDKFIAEKLAQLNKFNMEAGTTEAEQPQSAEEDVNNIWTNEAGTSGRDEEKENIENGSTDDEDDGFETDPMIAGSDQSDEEENTSMKAEELPELPNMEGLVRSRELLAQVLLPCRDFLKFFCVHVKNKNKVISRSTAGCLLAFRIAGKEQIIVDEIVSVKQCKETNWLSDIHFKLGHAVVSVYELKMVHESEVTDQVFDEWLQRLTVKGEPVPNMQAKYKRKVHAVARQRIESDKTERKKFLIVVSKLPNDLGRLVVTAEQVQLLADNLALDELRRVLAGCFVIVRMFALEQNEQPTMCGLFVVPIFQIDAIRTLLYFISNQRSPIRHNEARGVPLTNEVGLLNMDESQKLNRKGKLILQTIAELNIPLPDKEEIAERRHRLDEGLAEAGNRRRRQAIAPTTIIQKALQEFPGSFGTTTNVLPHSLPNQPVQTKRQKRKRRIGTIENGDAGKVRDVKRQRTRNDL